MHIRLQNAFQNGSHPVRAEFGFANISVLETHRNMVLVAIPVFSRSRNPIKQVKITLGIIVYAAILNFKMAATTFRPKLGFPIYRYRKLIHLVYDFGVFSYVSWVNEPNKSNNDNIGSLILACAAILNFTMTTAVFGPKLVLPITWSRKLVET